MAIAGGACSAYRFSIVHGALEQVSMAYPQTRCLVPAEAVARLAQGFPVMVAGPDALTFRRLWEAEQEAARAGL